ncbi:MAG: cytochrome c biogenesis protein CcsA [Planctomycetaceae bacterium]|nr:cytochrome c biogenesis protein CcsA [Planctomycetaceae bacterium]
MLSNVTLLCFFASYLCALALEATRLWVKSAVVRWAAIGFASAGFVAHMAYLLTRASAADLPPLLSSTHDWLLVLAFLAVVIYLFVSVLDRNLGFGLFLLPIVVLMVGASRFVNQSTDARLSAVRSWGMLHATMWVLGAAGVIIALVLSVMYLVQHRRLRHKTLLQDGLELPSLERLGRLNWWAIVVSVPLLTLGMATGVGLSLIESPVRNSVRLSEPSIVISLLLWMGMMGLFVWLLVAPRTPGKLVAWRTMWACGFLLVTLIILEIFSQGGIHGVRENGEDVEAVMGHDLSRSESLAALHRERQLARTIRVPQGDSSRLHRGAKDS